jgi:prepilin-type N-terminal cleavage/methylation domain-containing protein
VAEAGFTLVELMIVVAIIAVILAFAIPSLWGARKSANEASAVSTIRTLNTCVVQYRTRFGAYPNMDDIMSAGYFPQHPIYGLETFTQSGYQFRIEYLNAGRTQYLIHGWPWNFGETGDRIFQINEVGRIRWYSPPGPMQDLE